MNQIIYCVKKYFFIHLFVIADSSEPPDTEDENVKVS